MAYALGAVQPFVKDIAEKAGPMLGVTDIGGWRASAADMSGHPAGLALDFMVGSDKAKGNTVAQYFTQNASALRVKYVIWQQRIWYPGKGWAGMEFRSGDKPGYDPNHMRHVHVSFNGSSSGYGERVDIPAGWSPDDLLPDLPNPIEPLQQLVSGDLWKRVGLVIGGAGLIVMGVAILVASSKEVQNAVGSAAGIAGAVPHPVAKAVGVAGAAKAATSAASE